MPRDDFLKSTKRLLAERVAWRCSFPGCPAPTIGPGGGPEDVTRLGEAAHITGAAPGGERYDPSLTPEQRRHSSNGIWMCRPHARLIDVEGADQYSADTIRQWKALAEAATRAALIRGGAELRAEATPTTLIQIGFPVVARARWLAATEEQWKFQIVEFVRGDEIGFRDLVERGGADFVVVGSQGDGRVLAGRPVWAREEAGLVVSMPVKPRAPRIQPGTLRDLALEDGDLVIDGGHLREVHGLDADLQQIRVNLQTHIGEWFLDPSLGSLASIYYRDHGHHPELFEELLRLELARMATIPLRDPLGERLEVVVTLFTVPGPDGEALPLGPADRERLAAGLTTGEPREAVPPLGFIWRVEGLRLAAAPTDCPESGSFKLSIDLDLRWTDFEKWRGRLQFSVTKNPTDPSLLSRAGWTG